MGYTAMSRPTRAHDLAEYVPISRPVFIYHAILANEAGFIATYSLFGFPRAVGLSRDPFGMGDLRVLPTICASPPVRSFPVIYACFVWGCKCVLFDLSYGIDSTVSGVDEYVGRPGISCLRKANESSPPPLRSSGDGAGGEISPAWFSAIGSFLLKYPNQTTGDLRPPAPLMW